MAEAVQSRVWLMRALFMAVALLVPLVHLMPLSPAPRQWAPPDIMLALIYAWAVRRPDFVPLPIVVLSVLLADFLLQRPPGLWTALVVIAVQWAKSRERRQQDPTLALEWTTFALTVVGLTLAYRAVLLVTLVPPGPLYLAAMQAAFTILIYPLVVLISHFILGVRRIAPGDLDS